MKRERLLNLGLLSMMAAVVCASIFAYAANVTPTPVVGPTETGENSAGSQQITDMARLKLGSGTVSSTGSTTAQTATLNFAAGVVTSASLTTGASGASPATITLTNSKVQAGDMADCNVDMAGLTAGSIPSCNVTVSAGQVIFTITSSSATAITTSTIKVYFMVWTAGNPN